MQNLGEVVTKEAAHGIIWAATSQIIGKHMRWVCNSFSSKF